MTTTWCHPKCGKTIVQHGNRTGHCPKCHETFEGLRAFDAHQQVSPDGHVTCLDPHTIRVNGHFLVLRDGSWRGPGFDASERRMVFGGTDKKEAAGSMPAA